MISEMTRPVLRLEGPSGSHGSVSGPPPVAAVILRSPVGTVEAAGPSLAARDCRAEANEKRTATSQSGVRKSFCLMVWAIQARAGCFQEIFTSHRTGLQENI